MMSYNESLFSVDIMILYPKMYVNQGRMTLMNICLMLNKSLHLPKFH